MARQLAVPGQRRGFGPDGPPTEESDEAAPQPGPLGEGHSAFPPSSQFVALDDGYVDARFPGTTYTDGAYGDVGYLADPYSDAYGDSSYGDDPYGGDVFEDDVYGEDEDEGGKRRGLARLGMVLGVIVLLLLGAVAAAGFWFMRQVNPSSGPGDPVTVELAEGMSTADIAQLLADHGVVTDARVFTLYSQFRSQGDIQAGTYERLQEDMAMGDVLSILAEGPEVGEGQATITEGQTVDDLVELLGGISRFDEAALRSALENDVTFEHLPEGMDSPEGMLAAGQYDLGDDPTEAEFLQRMADRFSEMYTDLSVDDRAGELDIGGDVTLSGYEVVVVASMIEKEALLDGDRGYIARVIYNRLAQGRPLQIDATACYEVEEVPCRLTTEVLEGDSPYNTRTEQGLPPTPIAMPSEASLEAALDPPEGAWDHYVLDVEADDGSHVFTDDHEEFEEARQRCIEAGSCG